MLDSIHSAFHAELQTEFRALNFSSEFIANCRSSAIHEYLKSQHSLADICSPSVFFLIESDPLNWLAYCDESLFLKLLPVFMLVACAEHRTDSENLRGFLLGYLSPSKHSSESQLAIMNYLYEKMTTQQVTVIDAFISLYE